jgi:hypothetical protein
MPRQARIDVEGCLYDDRILGSGEFVESMINEPEVETLP